MSLSQGISPKISDFKLDTQTQVNTLSDRDSDHQVLDLGSRSQQLQREEVALGMSSLSQLPYT